MYDRMVGPRNDQPATESKCFAEKLDGRAAAASSYVKLE